MVSSLFLKRPLVDKSKSPPPKVVDRKEFTQGCRPSVESNTKWSLHFPNDLPRKKGKLSRL